MCACLNLWLFSQESSVKFLSVPLPYIFILIPQQK